MYTITVYTKDSKGTWYKSNILPMTGDTYPPSAFPELGTANIWVVTQRQLHTDSGLENHIIITVAPKH